MASIVIVGAGVLGAALADRLARSGWDVTLVEALTPGHLRAGSGDESRLIRCAHGQDVLHTGMARRALDLWRDLDERLVVQAGVVWLARRDDGWEAASERVLRESGVPVERVDPAALYPSVRTDDLAFALLEPQAGVLHARRAVQALVARAMAAGARLVTAVAKPDGDRVALDTGQVLEADRVVWACGAWLPRLFAGDGVLDLRITQQDVFYFGAGAAWATPGVPAWVDYDGAAYGLGDLDGRGFKLAPDVEGPPFDPQTGERVPRPEHERFARDYLAHRFPALAAAPLIGTRVCQYELTADTRFVVAAHPGHDGRVWILGGGSGHAFKHGPALAEDLERWLGGAAPEACFALGPRAVDVKLRTAGSTR
ncbi:MAG TPA: FAD-dependent oxidoreductase [Pseudonocardiaceae bacterium]|nr:FAD-dependent oxidoreductase [Pseudonocardiaceae bacterium]